ncbi:MAG: hypothetical protein ACJ79C_04875, partial [Myxococcales bacterium]
LLPYASTVVNTRASRRAVRRRRAKCLAYASGHRHGGGFVRLRLFMLIGPMAAAHLDDGAGEWAAREAIRRRDIEGGFALLDSLLETPPLAPPVAREPELRVAGPAPDLVVQP